MNLLRKHWYDIGAVLSVIVGIYVFLYHGHLTSYQTLMWVSLVSLFLHQVEEYRIPGTFPGMVNTVMYHSEMPDRYPLNTNTAFYVNAAIGWTVYFLAAVFAEKAVWLGIATIMISIGNTIAHTFIFNIKGRTFYNAGLVTCWLLFAPCIYFFFSIIQSDRLADTADYCIGIALGIILNVVGILKLIDWMADKNTAYIFSRRNLLPEHRKNH
ncbi:MAG: HXXEE domain-containing protein [Ignavibacteria bacterium]|nr:HXXEE domain-containing protein [Ignavibacteria bacterium]